MSHDDSDEVISCALDKYIGKTEFEGHHVSEVIIWLMSGKKRQITSKCEAKSRSEAGNASERMPTGVKIQT